jgi:YD repeat-containing protein
VAAGGASATPNVSFNYDANGNRLTMTDGLGSVTYNYDTLSQMTSEARYFSEINQTKTIS